METKHRIGNEVTDRARENEKWEQSIELEMKLLIGLEKMKNGNKA